MFYFNTNKPQSLYLCRTPVALESRRLSRGGGGEGAHLLPALPLDSPLEYSWLHFSLEKTCYLGKNLTLSWLTLIYERYLLLTISPIYHSLISDGVGRGGGGGGWRGALSYEKTYQTGESFGMLTNPEQLQSMRKIGSLTNNDGDG